MTEIQFTFYNQNLHLQTVSIPGILYHFEICVDCESCEMKELILLHVIASLALCQQFHQPQDFQRNYNHDHNHQVLHNDINQERE